MNYRKSFIFSSRPILLIRNEKFPSESFLEIPIWVFTVRRYLMLFFWRIYRRKWTYSFVRLSIHTIQVWSITNESSNAGTWYIPYEWTLRFSFPLDIFLHWALETVKSYLIYSSWKLKKSALENNSEPLLTLFCSQCTYIVMYIFFFKYFYQNFGKNFLARTYIFGIKIWLLTFGLM